MKIKIQTEDFDAGTEIKQLSNGNLQVGAIVSFIGLVRDINDNAKVTEIVLEHYPGMTEKALVKIVDDARARWAIVDALVIHRIGRLLPNEQIVLVAVASAHRRDAFDACEFIMDYLKTHAPFWKKESLGEKERWVEAKVADEALIERWQQKKD